MDILLIAPIKGFMARDGGYGNSSFGLYNALMRMVENKTINSVTILNSLVRDNEYLEKINKHYDIGIIYTNPNMLATSPDVNIVKNLLVNCKKRYINILWETLPLPSLWERLWVDVHIDGFLVSSYFVGNQIMQKTKKPVYYFPIYVDENIYKPISDEEREKENLFTVLFVGQNTKRKGVEDSVIAYSRAFEQMPDTQFIMKCYPLSNKELSTDMIIQRSSITNMSCKESPIYLIEDEIGSEEMIKLYQSSSALLFLSRGEGWGLPAHEAMLCGLPVVYANWSCLREICNNSFNIPVTCYLDEAHSMYHYGYEIGSFYGVPSISESINALKVLYFNWKKNKKDYYTITNKNRDYIINNYSLEICIEYIDNFLFEKNVFCPEKYYKKDLMDTCKKEWDFIHKK